MNQNRSGARGSRPERRHRSVPCTGFGASKPITRSARATIRRKLLRRARNVVALDAQIGSARVSLLAAVRGGAAELDPRVARSLANALAHLLRARELLLGKAGSP